MASDNPGLKQWFHPISHTDVAWCHARPLSHITIRQYLCPSSVYFRSVSVVQYPLFIVCCSKSIVQPREVAINHVFSVVILPRSSRPKSELHVNFGPLFHFPAIQNTGKAMSFVKNVVHRPQCRRLLYTLLPFVLAIGLRLIAYLFFQRSFGRRHLCDPTLHRNNIVPSSNLVSVIFEYQHPASPFLCFHSPLYLLLVSGNRSASFPFPRAVCRSRTRL